MCERVWFVGRCKQKIQNIHQRHALNIHLHQIFYTAAFYSPLHLKETLAAGGIPAGGIAPLSLTAGNTVHLPLTAGGGPASIFKSIPAARRWRRSRYISAPCNPCRSTFVPSGIIALLAACINYHRR